jgi:hypothetical protein
MVEAIPNSPMIARLAVRDVSTGMRIAPGRMERRDD